MPLAEPRPLLESDAHRPRCDGTRRPQRPEEPVGALIILPGRPVDACVTAPVPPGVRVSSRRERRGVQRDEHLVADGPGAPVVRVALGGRWRQHRPDRDEPHYALRFDQQPPAARHALRVREIRMEGVASSTSQVVVVQQPDLQQRVGAALLVHVVVPPAPRALAHFPLVRLEAH